MGVYIKLNNEEYKELEKKFILHCEADPKSTDYSLYVDNKNKLTFGIGFNIEDNSNWLAIALLHKFSGLKSIEEINQIGYQTKVLSYGNGKYDNFIEENCSGNGANNKVLQIIRKYKTAKNTKVKNIDKLSKEIQELIDKYNKRSDIEKIPVKDFSFEFTDDEISLIYDVGKKEYENQLEQYLTGVGRPFNSQSIKDTTLYISLLSFTYQQGGGSLEKHSNIFQGVDKSRFLLWFTLRYNVLSFTRQYKRRLHESTLFGLIDYQAVDTKKADIPATILDVFSYLNFFMASVDNTYLSYIKTTDRCKIIDTKAVDDGLVLFNKQSRYDVIKNSLQTVDFIKDFFTDASYFKGKFLDNIIDFASHTTIFSIFTQFIKESFGEELKTKKGSEEIFLLENIYVVECINKEKFLELMELKYSSLQEKCNVLVFLNSTLDIVNDLSHLQSKCPNVHFTIAVKAGYTYSFRLDDKSSAQTNIMLYSIKEGKYIPELLKDTFKAENISNEESHNDKNILLFSAEENNNLSGRLSNNANLFHITHQSEEKIISKIKLYNLISDKYEGNIQVDMQDKEYKVSSNKSSGEFRVDVTLSILDKVLNEDDLNDKPYYMFVNNTGEIFESRISNGKATFCYNPAETNSNQKVLFSFNREDFACKKSANSKSLDFMLINKTDRENKKAERTFTINKGDVVKPIKFTSLPDKETIEGDAFLYVLEDDDIIRIEAEDGSEEYIEIIFPKDNKDWKDIAIDIGKAAGEYALDRITDLATIKKGGRLGRLGKIANFTDNAKKVLTKKDVLDIIKNKYGLKKENSKGKDQNAYIARDNNQIKEIWEDISKDAKEIENKIDSFDHPIIRRELDDGTEIQLRKQSGSGGSTIEIDKSKTKIHNEAGEIGDW